VLISGWAEQDSAQPQEPLGSVPQRCHLIARVAAPLSSRCAVRSKAPIHCGARLFGHRARKQAKQLLAHERWALEFCTVCFAPLCDFGEIKKSIREFRSVAVEAIKGERPRCFRVCNSNRLCVTTKRNTRHAASPLGDSLSPCSSASLGGRIRCARSAADWRAARES